MGHIFGAIGAFLGRLWRIAQFWRLSPLGEVRTGSTLAGGLMFLVMLFGIIGAALVTLGFDLDRVDIWLDAQSGWLDAVGTLLFRIMLGCILLICGVIILGWALIAKIPSALAGAWR